MLQTKEDPSSSATITKTTIYFEAATNLVIPTGTHIPLLTAASNHVELSLTQINLLENREGGCETDSHVSTKLCNSLAWAEAVQSLCNCTDTGYKTHDQIELDAPRNVCTPWGYAKCSSEKRPECLYLTLIKQNCHKPNCFINEFRTILTTSEIRQDYGRKWRNETDQNIQYTRLFVYYQILGHRSFSEFHSMTFDSVLSAVGGNIGLFLGASIISVVQLGSTIMLGLKRILNRLTN